MTKKKINKNSCKNKKMKNKNEKSKMENAAPSLKRITKKLFNGVISLGN